MSETKPQPYAYCETHFVAKCPICKPGQAQPTPVNDQDLPATPKAAPAVQSVGAAPPAPPPEPVTVSDPTAQKAMDAAKEYSEAVQAAIVVADQLKQARELVKVLEQKHTALKKLAKEKLDITVEASK